MKMIRQGLEALDQETQEPLEFDTHGTTNAVQRQALQQQALDQSSGVIRDEVLLQALDKLTATVLALMVLFAVVNVTIFLVFGGLTARTHILDEHSFVLTPFSW